MPDWDLWTTTVTPW